MEIPDKVENLIGNEYGRWTVIGYAGKNTTQSHHLWWCECSCIDKTRKKITGGSLKAGKSKSCKCLMKELKTTHGMWHTLEHKCLAKAWDRCYGTRPKHKRYRDKNLVVCDRYNFKTNLNAAQNLIDDIGSRPSNKYSLDRIDNDLGYIEGNLRWATASQQARNKDPHGKVPYKGVCLSENGKRFVVTIFVDGKNKSLGRFNTAEEAAEAYDDAYEELFGTRPNAKLLVERREDAD